MNAKRALITGGAGFVGACLARRLTLAGHRVELVVRPQSDRWRIDDLVADAVIHEIDLRDTERVKGLVKMAAPEWVFHCAAHGAYSWQTDSRGIYESNVLGTLNLAEACVRHGFDAFVHAGSSSEYGCKDHAPHEDELPEPNSDYAIAKLATTLLCGSLAVRHGLRMTTLRLYSVYGPWEDPRRLMPVLITNCLRGELPALVDPTTARDFVYVDDVCEAFLLACQASVAGSAGVYNVGSGHQTTLGDLVARARALFDLSREPQWGTYAPRRWDTAVWVAEPSKIGRELGWRASTSVDDGMVKMARWLNERPELRMRYLARERRAG